MEPKRKKSILKGIPSWGLALLTLAIAFPILMIVSDIILLIFNIPEENEVAEWVFYTLYNLIIAAGCFYICRQNPRSIFYVPLVCNIVGIISAIGEENFWKSSLWIIICNGWVVSLIASIVGALLGRKENAVMN